MKTKCEACGKFSECEVWGIPVCYVCAADYGAKQPTAWSHHKHNRSDPNAAAKEFALRWLERRKRVAA